MHLAANKFSADERKLASELKNLKRIVRHYYANKPVSEVWQCILRCRRLELPNICMLVDMVMGMGVSNGFVESCFSFLTAMLSDRRLSMCHNTMADLLLLRANHLAWMENEREDLINDTVNTYMSSRRKLKLSDSNSYGGAYSQPPAKVAAISSNFTEERKSDDLFSDNDEMLQDSNGSDDDTDESGSESNDDDLNASDLDIAEANIMRRSNDCLTDSD